MSKLTSEPALRHITTEIVNRMLKLESLFHEKILTTDLLNELVSTYVEAIECFDHTYTPMRKYFLSRIQYVVSQPEIDNMLKRNANNQGSMIDAIRETVRATVQKGGIEESITQEMLIKAMEEERKKYNKHQGMSSKAYKQKSKEPKPIVAFNQPKQKTPQQAQQLKQMEEKKAINKEKKIEMEMNLMKQVSENIKNFENQDKKIIKQTKRINALMVEQNNTLEARLAMRKKGKANRKKSIDQKFVQEAKQVMPVIQKQELKTAQKQIQQAVERMTARLTMRQGTVKGATGLIIGRESNQEQKQKGKVKMGKEMNRIQEDEQDLLANDVKTNDKKSDTRGSQGGTARFTLGDGGGKNKIKMRNTAKLDDDEEELM